MSTKILHTIQCSISLAIQLVYNSERHSNNAMNAGLWFKKREEKEKHFPFSPMSSVRHASPPAISQIYKVPSPKHLGRGTVSPTQRLVTPSTHSMLSYCFDVKESAW